MGLHAQLPVRFVAFEQGGNGSLPDQGIGRVIEFAVTHMVGFRAQQPVAMDVLRLHGHFGAEMLGIETRPRKLTHGTKRDTARRPAATQQRGEQGSAQHQRGGQRIEQGERGELGHGGSS